ncbi:hypothetical protein ACEN9F_30450 [Duganella sp. CT11-25]|uniref:hypothetical protein n=1 Tax=unclassified Duganella TaxID=2636909 RepID=UPI0039B07F09
MTHKIILAFLRLRREIRSRQQLNTQIYWTVRRARRDVGLLKKGTVFEQARATTIAARADALDQVWHADNLYIRQLGRKLLAMAPAFDVVTTFEQRLDLLNVNVADRAAIEHGAGLVMIIAGHCLEDSAARRGEHHHSGTLFDAVQLEIIIQMSSTAEGRAAADKVMVDVFGARAYSLFGQKPDLQLITSAPLGAKP